MIKLIIARLKVKCLKISIIEFLIINKSMGSTEYIPQTIINLVTVIENC